MKPETERQLNFLARDCVGESEAQIRAAIFAAFRLGNDTAFNSVIQMAEFSKLNKSETS